MEPFKLMAHQEEAIQFALKNEGVAAFYHEVGCGKTLSALSTFETLQRRDKFLNLLVICPLSLIHGAWTRELQKFFPGPAWYDLHGGIGQKAPNVFYSKITLVNFEYLVSKAKFEKMKAGLQQWIDDGGSWMCVIDESSKMKNNRAITVQRILELKKYFKYRIIMSGTPAPNIEWEYWAQMNFLSDNILGWNFYKFKNTYFALSRGRQVIPGAVFNRHELRQLHEKGFKYSIKESQRPVMFERMKPWCHFVKAKDCIDLPEEIDEFRSVELTDEQARVYRAMKEAYVAEIKQDQFVVANVALTKLMKLRQITSGFAIDERENAVGIGAKNPKMDALLDLVEECGTEQMIIWANFHWETQEIVKALSPLGGVSQLHGMIPEHERNTHLENFLNGTNRFLVANPHSAAHGLTLTNCHIAVFFSMDYSMEGYSQARGRIYRKGQKNNCLYFHLLAQGTIDEDVLKIVQRKETAQEVAERYLRG